MALKNTDEKANCAIDKIILKSNYRSSHKFLDAFCINRQALYVILMYQSTCNLDVSVKSKSVHPPLPPPPTPGKPRAFDARLHVGHDCIVAILM